MVWYSDGLAVGRADGKTYDQSGGFGITSEGKTEIVIFGLLSDVFTYDEANDILIGESGEFASREKISAHYVANDESPIHIYLTKNKTFVIVDGALANYQVSGEFKDGATIVINGVNYLVDGSSLLKEEVEEPDPEPVENTFVWTWSGKIGQNNVTIAFNDDGTGLYGEMEFTYTVDGNSISANIGDGTYYLEATYDSETQTLTGNVHDEYYEFTSDFELTDYQGFEEEKPSTNSFYGSWTGELNKLGETTFIFNSDGTGKYGDFTFEYTVTDNVITASFDAYELTATFDPEKGTMEIEMWYDYSSEYSGVFTEFVPE